MSLFWFTVCETSGVRRILMFLAFLRAQARRDLSATRCKDEKTIIKTSNWFRLGRPPRAEQNEKIIASRERSGRGEGTADPPIVLKWATDDCDR